MNLTFDPLNSSHFPLLLKWLKTPHVKKWWDQEVIWTLDLIKEKYGCYVKGYKQSNGIHKPIHAYIICINNHPLGYVQFYNAYDFPRNKELTELPESLGAFDIFIGEQKYLGKNIGSQAIAEFLALYTKGYSYVFTDPDLDNISAIKAYEKAGFKKISTQKDINEVWMLWENKKYNKQSEIISNSNAPHFPWGNGCDGYWLKKEGSFTIISEIMPSGATEKRHLHRNTEQFFYCLNGILNIELNGKEHTLQEGDGINVPPDVPHAVYNSSDKTVSFLIISCPNLLEDRVCLAE